MLFNSFTNFKLADDVAFMPITYVDCLMLALYVHVLLNEVEGLTESQTVLSEKVLVRLTRCLVQYTTCIGLQCSESRFSSSRLRTCVVLFTDCRLARQETRLSEH